MDRQAPPELSGAREHEEQAEDHYQAAEPAPLGPAGLEAKLMSP